jgi:DNA polymerase-3 subunit chi
VSGERADALRVDFYILDTDAPNGRLQLACKLAEKAYLAEQSVLIWHTDGEELRSLDEMLWTFRDGSFVPHEMTGATRQAAPNDTPVTLSAGVAPSGPVDVLINLAPDVPPCVAQSKRVIEIIDGDETRRKAGRTRFKAYRDSGVQPASHNVQL